MDKKTFLCPYCQEELIEGAKFCKKCGARLNVCPDCGHPLKPEAQFCPKCGARLVSLSAMEENRHTADSPEAPAYEPPGKPVPAVPEYVPSAELKEKGIYYSQVKVKKGESFEYEYRE